MKQEKKGIYNFLKNHSKKNTISFHMPGHKGRNLYHFEEESLSDILKKDITEIKGADNLFSTTGIIKETSEKYKKLYNSKKSYLLVNGTSCGLISSIISCVEKNEKLIIARNCHKSVYNAVKLNDIEAVYVNPEIDEYSGISMEISVENIENIIKNNLDAKAVVLPSPNYYGVCSDIEKISEIVHAHNMILIVDQAHGAHLKFFEGTQNENFKLPKSAEELGADIVVNSTHKTLASLTQSAVLNVMSENIEITKLEDSLQVMESSSPSYLLMASLDLNADLLLNENNDLMHKWKDNITYFYKESQKIENLNFVKNNILFDITKINIDSTSIGITGIELEEELIKRNIYPELVTGNIVMCMTGIGNTRSDYVSLLNSLSEIEKIYSKDSIHLSQNSNEETEILKKIFEKNNVVGKKTKKIVDIEIDKSEGEVCAISIIPYPPGIPIIVEGEIISKEIIAYVKMLINDKRTVMGINEGNLISVYS